ncbi:MAG: hypothetical protein Q8Q04_00680 [archaeon]|nr:hypothetical protein [archaeon]
MKKKSSKKGWLNYLIYLIWALLLFAGIYDLFHIPGRAIFWFGELIIAMFIYYKLKVPVGIYFGILILFLINLFGELFIGLFYIIPQFDKIIHILSPLIGCTLFYFLFEKKIKNKKMLILFSVILLISWGALWEIVEYFSDKYFHTLLVGVHLAGIENFKPIQIMEPLEDTIYDMFYSLIGTVVWAIIALFVTKNKNKHSRVKTKKH